MRIQFDKIKRKATEIPLIKNILIMGSGTGIAQLLPIITAPIVTRLYLPEHFGIYALYYSLSTIFYGFATLDYHNVIIIGETQEKSFLGISLSLTVAAFLCTIILLFFTFIPLSVFKSVFGWQILPFLQIIPLTVFANVLNTVLYNWFLRQGEYKFLSKNKIILAICSVILQVGIGLLQVGAIGFIIANLAATFIAISLMALEFNRNYQILYPSYSLKAIKKIAFEYKKFSLISVWGNALNIITLQIPDLLLSKLFGSYVLGQYSLAQRMITMPSSFIASSIQEVFRQSASQENRETGNCKLAYMRTLKITSVLAFLIFIASLTVIPSLFVYLFGDKWVDAGIYVRVMCLLFAIRLVVPPLSYVFYLKNKQQIDFIWQIGLFIISLGGLYSGYYIFNLTNPIYLLLLYTCTTFLWYSINLYLTYKIVYIENKIYK